VIVFHEPDHRREQWVHGGWNLTDDDLPHAPDCDPLSSAQHRRAWREAKQVAAAES
jgi:hypothetical protein